MIKTAKHNDFRIGDDLPVRRLGFGAMRLTGEGVWGPPKNRQAAQAVLRRVLELGINFIDTADVYGPGDNERLLRDTLQPYPGGLVIGTKGGMTRSGPATPDNPGMGIENSEAHLRRAVEGSLRDLGVERIDLYQLHRADPHIPIEDTMGVLLRMRDEGKIYHVGLSAVEIEVIARARSVIDIATVQNEYNLVTRRHEDVVDYCEKHDIGFLPFYPQRIGALGDVTEMKDLAARKGATPA
jgi:pyridoxine 4-dehydrogenase